MKKTILNSSFSMDKNMKNMITDFAHQNHIPLIGFTNYKLYSELKPYYEKKRALNYDVFMNDINSVIDVKKVLNSVNTIIVIAIPYPKLNKKIGVNEVYFSTSSWGLDYHKVLNNKLDTLINFINKYAPNFEYVKCVDTKPVDDRYLAYQAGLGFYGENNLLINPNYGSYIFIGSLLTNLDLKSDQPLLDKCSNCHKCSYSCPTKAIKSNGLIDSSKCLSYLTQKKQLSKEEKELINKCIYGCDICSLVCPYNEVNNYDESFELKGIEIIDLRIYQPLSNKEFRNKYGFLSGSWRGAKVINRNIQINQEKLVKK